MTTKDRIAEYLQRHPEGVDDGGLTIALGIRNHAHTNAKCHELVREGFVKREEKNGTLHNFWLGIPYASHRYKMQPEMK